MPKLLPINGFNKYLISKDGFVINAKTGRPLTPVLADDGYLTVNLLDGNAKRKLLKVHNLVAEHFVRPYHGDDLVAKHINGDRSNNDHRNLQWIVQKKNTPYTTKPHLCTCLCGYNVTRIAKIA